MVCGLVFGRDIMIMNGCWNTQAILGITIPEAMETIKQYKTKRKQNRQQCPLISFCSQLYMGCGWMLEFLP